MFNLKKFLRTLLSLTLVVALLPIEVFARDNVLKLADNEHAVTSRDNTATMRTGWGIRMGIGRCYKETFDGSSSLTNWVLDYSSKYYVRPEGDCAYLYLEGQGLHSDEFSSYTTAVQYALQCAAGTGHSGYIEKINGTVPGNNPEMTDILNGLSALTSSGGLNSALVDELMIQQSSSKPYHPLVLCFEAFSAYSGMGETIYTCSDLADTMDAVDLCEDAFTHGSSYTNEALLNSYGFTTTIENPGDSVLGTNKVSDVGLYIISKNKTAFNENAIPGFIFQGMFGFYPTSSYKNLTYGKKSSGASNIAYTVKQPGNSNITGCRIEALIAPDPSEPTGSYTWHINANNGDSMSLHSYGDKSYYEDGSVEVPTGTMNLSKTCYLKDFDIYQSNYAIWRRFIELNNYNHATINLKIYSRGTADNVANFSADPYKIQTSPDVSSHLTGITQPSARDFTVDYPNINEFKAAITDPTRSILSFGGSREIREQVGGLLNDGVIAVGYATKMTVTLSGPSGSTTIPLSNDQSHFLIYGHDDGTTCKYLQALQPGYTQVKDNMMDNATYEAMAGVPTTDDLFISQGGEQWVVNMQYRYVTEDYTRSYRFYTNEPYPNYMYYKITVPEPDGYDVDGKNGIFELVHQLNYVESYSCPNTQDPFEKTQGNIAYKKNKEAIDKDQTLWRKQIFGTKNMQSAGVLEQVLDQLFASIDDNYQADGKGADTDYNYPVIVRKGLTVAKIRKAINKKDNSYINPYIKGSNKLVNMHANDQYSYFNKKYTRKLLKTLVKLIDYNRKQNVDGFNGPNNCAIGRFVIPLVVTGNGQDLDSPQEGMVYLLVRCGYPDAPRFDQYPSTYWHLSASQTARATTCRCPGDNSEPWSSCSCGTMPEVTVRFRYYWGGNAGYSNEKRDWVHSCSETEQGYYTGPYTVTTKYGSYSYYVWHHMGWSCGGAYQPTYGPYADLYNRIDDAAFTRRRANNYYGDDLKAAYGGDAEDSESPHDPDDEDYSSDDEDGDEAGAAGNALGTTDFFTNYVDAAGNAVPASALTGNTSQIIDPNDATYDNIDDADYVEYNEDGTVNFAVYNASDTSVYDSAGQMYDGFSVLEQAGRYVIETLPRDYIPLHYPGEIYSADYEIYRDSLFGVINGTAVDANGKLRYENYEMTNAGYNRVCPEYVKKMHEVGNYLTELSNYYKTLDVNTLSSVDKDIYYHIDAAAKNLCALGLKSRYGLMKRKIMLSIDALFGTYTSSGGTDPSLLLSIIDGAQLLMRSFDDENSHLRTAVQLGFDPTQKTWTPLTPPKRSSRVYDARWGYETTYLTQPNRESSAYANNFADTPDNYTTYNIPCDIYINVDQLRETISSHSSGWRWPFTDFSDSQYKLTYGTYHEWPVNYKKTITDTEFYNAGYIVQVAVQYAGFSRDKKMLYYDKTIYQTFQDVKFMDIVDCHVWRLAGGVEHGLSSLLSSSHQSLDSPLIQNAAQQKGYVLYDVKDTANAARWNTEYTNGKGESEKAWTYASDRIALNKNSAVTDLHRTGRLVNSFMAGSQARYVPASLKVNNYVSPNDATSKSGPHSFKLKSTSGDTMTFVYDIEEQGGRSHWSLPGFLVQAFALTFYSSKDPKSAYKNYILCQGDYLSLHNASNSASDNSWSTLVGFMFNSKRYIPNPTSYNKNDEDGLQQTILSYAHNDVSKYWTDSSHHNSSYDYWKKGTLLGRNDNKKGSGVNGHIVRDVELSMPDNIELYQDCKGQVILNKSNEYKAITKKALINSMNNTFATTYSSAGLTESGSMCTVGYRGDHSTISTNHTPQYGVTQTFNPNNTFITNGCSETNSTYASLNNGNDTFKRLDPNFNNSPKSSKPDSEGEGYFVNGGRSNGATYYYPYNTGYNTQRNLANGLYETGHGALVYEKCIDIETPQEGAVSAIPSITLYDNFTDAHSAINVSTSALRDVLSDAYNNEGFLHRADYDSDTTRVNDIVIYNPTGAETAQVVRLTDTVSNSTLDSEAFPVRNQAVQPHITTYGKLQESYFSGSEPYVNDAARTPRKTYQMLDVSHMATTAYSMDDYVQTGGSDISAFSVTNGQQVTIATASNYVVTTNGSDGSSLNLVVPLHANDKVSMRDNTVYVDYDIGTYSAKFSDLSAAFEDYYEDHPSEMPTGYNPDNLYLETKDNQEVYLGIGLDLKKGAVLKFSLPFNTASDNPVEVKFVTSSTDDHDTYTQTSDRSLHNYYMEAKDDTTLAGITLKFKGANRINHFGDSSISILPTFICDVTDSSDVVSISTLDHDYNGSITGHRRSYNKLFVVSDTSAKNATTDANTSFISSINDRAAFDITDSAKNNPHQVWNAYWKYYVLGWTTVGGHMITNINDTVLNDPNAVLKYPDAEGTVKVGDIRSNYCLVKSNDVLYLTTVADAKNHKITTTGKTVDHFDYWSLSPNPDATIVIDTLSFASNTYPLKSTADITYFRDTYQYKYEFCFKLADVDGKPLFDVQFSKNPAYNFKSNDMTHLYYGPAKTSTDKYDRDADWEGVDADEVALATRRAENVDIANLISLDDEFDILWNNRADISGTNVKDIGEPSEQIGYGWNHVNVDNNVVYKSAIDSYGAVGGAITDVTKWLYVKYVTFDFPVYGFYCPLDSGSKAVALNGFNPTRGAYYLDGGVTKQSTLVLVPANTRVFLGYYEGDSGDGDNGGHFVDFGTPTLTKDVNNKAYRYHFWSSIGAGEREGAKMHAESITINSAPSNVDYSTTPGHAYYARDYLNQNTQSTNSASPEASTERYTDAQLDSTFNLVGRIGALTIIESEDPRWSDTFKNGAPSTEYLIYPLVKKITSYSNISGRIGAQNKIILDPFDVRGRIANTDMLNAFKQSIKPEYRSAYNGYTVYPVNPSASASEYNSYGTQWYKNGTDKGGALKAAIPMKGTDNIHEELQLTEQKIGYNLYCTIETIGNYYGTSNWNENRADPEYLNDSADYNNYKVQIRPLYSVFEAKTNNDEVYTGFVDAYMRLGNDYVMINSGSTNALDYLECMSNSYYTYDIDTNTGTYENLDQNMLRHSVTPDEASVTKQVIDWMNSYTPSSELLGTTGDPDPNPIDDEDTFVTSLITPGNYTNNLIGGEGSDTKYTYGNSQMLFLRERNRTFVGGDTIALGYAAVEADSESDTDRLNKYAHAQKWYFELGLASSTIFVPTGRELTTENILKEGYCVCGLDIYANGNPYMLHYQSKVSDCNVKIRSNSGDYVELTPGEWNPEYGNGSGLYPNLVPFSYYDLSETNSSVDIDTQGSQ